MWLFLFVFFFLDGLAEFIIFIGSLTVIRLQGLVGNRRLLLLCLCRLRLTRFFRLVRLRVLRSGLFCFLGLLLDFLQVDHFIIFRFLLLLWFVVRFFVFGRLFFWLFILRGLFLWLLVFRLLIFRLLILYWLVILLLFLAGLVLRFGFLRFGLFFLIFILLRLLVLRIWCFDFRHNYSLHCFVLLALSPFLLLLCLIWWARELFLRSVTSLDTSIFLFLIRLLGSDFQDNFLGLSLFRGGFISAFGLLLLWLVLLLLLEFSVGLVCTLAAQAVDSFWSSFAGKLLGLHGSTESATDSILRSWSGLVEWLAFFTLGVHLNHILRMSVDTKTNQLLVVVIN